MVLHNKECELDKKENKFEFKIKSRKQFYKALIFSIFILLGSVYFYSDTNLTLVTQLMNVFLMLTLFMLMANYVVDESNYAQKYPNGVRYIRTLGRILYPSIMIIYYVYFFNNIHY